jgi:sugar transferase (PEP-CTERM/EpsH1 system associated)
MMRADEAGEATIARGSPAAPGAAARRLAGRFSPPLVAHIIHRLDVGGMENGLVNLINHMPAERYRHAIVCMTDYSDFSRNIRREGVELYALHKRPGKDFGVHARLWRVLRHLRPDIVHTRNLATVETQVTAALAGARHRVHGEHGWDVSDPDGSNLKNRRLRRLVRPLVGEYIALSRQQVDYLRDAIHVSAGRLSHVCNGVDTERFHPAAGGRETLPAQGIAAPDADTVVIGAVMRMQAVKAPDLLLEAFLRLLDQVPDSRRRLRLALIGDGPMLSGLRGRVEAAGAADVVWLPGMRSDIPALMRTFDLFVVPSHAEGISNTILEAMASGLPVLATAVGGNPDLVAPGETGALVAAGDEERMAAALAEYVGDRERLRGQGRAARELALRRFSMQAMVAGYLNVYDRVLARR